MFLMKNEERRINIRLTPERFREMDDLRHRADTTWQDLLTTLLDTWATGQFGASDTPLQSRRAAALDGLPRKTRAYIEMATEILLSGNAVAIDALTKNIEAFLELVRVTAQEQHTGGKEG